MSLFFVAFASIRSKRSLAFVIATLTLTFLAVFVYGVGQKYLGFPAYLTMNEEFAKGQALYLSALSRVPSTFAGHYDLAAYIVLVIPILASLIFGIKNWLLKIAFSLTSVLGVILILLTVSRVSFVVLLIALFCVVLFHKKRIAVMSIPVILIAGFIFLSSSTSLLQRFGNTINEVDVLVDAHTGNSIGNLEIVNPSYLDDKIIKTSFTDEDEKLSVSLDKSQDTDPASRSGRLLLETLPDEIPLVKASNISTGETLTQGTGYINLSLSPVRKKVGEFFYEKPLENNATASAIVHIVYGEYLIKRASAYDLSFTTRFQGGWPRAFDAFLTNIFFGSGYGSVSLAVDNNYLRLLGEIGILGFISFLGIFLTIGIYIKKSLPHVESPMVRSFVLGFASGVIGLSLNALLIDVFEASKIAFILWLLSGVTLGILHLYQKQPLNFYTSLRSALTSTYALVMYLVVIALLMLLPMVSNFFVADDFTWFRWASDCGGECPPLTTRISGYFTSSDGFFYRPGTKTYFLLMYPVIWLNQTAYHFVSLSLHISVALLLFFIAFKLTSHKRFAFLSVFTYLIISGYAEMVFWISATGHLFNAVCILLGLVFFILYREKQHIVYLFLSLLAIGLSLLFHELGIVAPLLIVLYYLVKEPSFSFANFFKRPSVLLLFIPIIIYLVVRYISGSHWFEGDYNYNVFKLPLNVVGNFVGYSLLTVVGPIILPVYSTLRELLRENIAIAGFLVVFITGVSYFVYKKIWNTISSYDKRVLIFGVLFTIITLLPFLGLGNISSRYNYLASFGIIMVLVLLGQTLYLFLLENGRDIALATISVVFVIFALFHIIQLQEIHGDWYEAGRKTENFFISLDGLYSDYWSEEPLELHFVHVPIKTGQAWVFPVGLNDALWLVFRNPKLEVYQHNSLAEAYSVASDPIYEKVLLFEDSGKLLEPDFDEER